MKPVLSGIKVLDFTHVLSGPIATHYLCLHGADVVKVESGRGDTMRNEIIVPEAAHGTNPATAAMCGCVVREIPCDANGDVDLTTFSMNSVSGFVAQGRLRALAVAARSRLKDYPQIPTLAEAGGPAVEMHPWAALVARAGTPQPLLDQLHRDVTAALGAAEVRARADTAGFELTPSTPQQLRERIAQDLALYRPLVAEGRISNA